MTDTKKEAAAKADAKADAAEATKAAAAKPAKVAPGSPGDPTDHSVSASEMAGKVDPAKKSGAAATAKAVDKSAAKAKEADAADAAEVDNSIVGKIRRSELYAVNDHPSGGGWYVGISPQNDPNASSASKRLSSVQPLDTFAPKTGLRVVPKDGDEFVVGEGFGPDATPADWAKVVTASGDPLFA